MNDGVLAIVASISDCPQFFQMPRRLIDESLNGLPRHIGVRITLGEKNFPINEGGILQLDLDFVAGIPPSKALLTVMLP